MISFRRSSVGAVVMAPVTLVAALVSFGACSSSDASHTLPLGAGGASGAPTSETQVPLAAKAALDSGNKAMRAKAYDAALAQYRVAVAAAPQHAAPWFGIYMVARELSDSALADSAMRHVRALTQDSTVLGSHGEVAAAAMPTHTGALMPAGHPKTNASGGPLTPVPSPAKPHP